MDMDAAPAGNEMAEQIFAIDYQEISRGSRKRPCYVVKVTCPDGSGLNIQASGLNIYNLTGGDSTHPRRHEKGQVFCIMGSEPAVARHQLDFEARLLIAIFGKTDRNGNPIKVVYTKEQGKTADETKLPIPDSIMAAMNAALQQIITDPSLIRAMQHPDSKY